MDRSRRALERNLHELGRAVLERKALVGMEKANTSHAVDFFRLAYDALFNDMIAHAIKVFDKNKYSETYWTIYERDKIIIDQFLMDNNYDIDRLCVIADKLKIIRDKTHFHIDRDGVIAPKDIWEKANLTGKDLAKAIDIGWKSLNYLHKQKIGKIFYFPKYNGTDITKIIKMAKREGII